MAPPGIARRMLGAELALALLGAGAMTCDGDDITSPERQASAITMVGGNRQTGAVGTGVRAAEVWNPRTGDWATLASSATIRGYHSVSILLPDGTVLHGASGDAKIPGSSTPYPDERSHEIFHPPYLFKGARPTIASAPAAASYGQSFLVSTSCSFSIGTESPRTGL